MVTAAARPAASLAPFVNLFKVTSRGVIPDPRPVPEVDPTAGLSPAGPVSGAPCPGVRRKKCDSMPYHNTALPLINKTFAGTARRATTMRYLGITDDEMNGVLLNEI